MVPEHERQDGAVFNVAPSDPQDGAQEPVWPLPSNPPCDWVMAYWLWLEGSHARQISQPLAKVSGQ